MGSVGLMKQYFAKEIEDNSMTDNETVFQKTYTYEDTYDLTQHIEEFLTEEFDDFKGTITVTITHNFRG